MSILVAGLLAAVLAPSVLAMSTPTKLSPRLDELATPALRSAPPADQAEELGLARSGPASLQRAGTAVVVDVRFERGAIARLGALEDAGARVLAPSRTYQTISAAIEPARLRALAAVPGVVSVSESLTPMVNSAATAVGGAGTCEGGEVISEGVEQLRVDEARQQFGLRGKGMTVGVLSDSFDAATAPLATDAQRDTEGNDLPGPAGSCSGQQLATNVLSDFAGGSDEGRAMAQIVHDLAPHAALAFATAFDLELSFAQNIEQLALPVASGGAGADVITDDVSYFEEPFFQDGPVAVAINKVTAAGVTYLTSAGNGNVVESGTGNEIGSWEAPEFRDTSCPPAVVTFTGGMASNCMDFDPGVGDDPTFGITVKPSSGFILDLQWAEPWFGVESDLDVYLLNAADKVVAEVDGDDIAAGRPVELMLWDNGAATAEVRLVISRCTGVCNPAANSAAKPRLKFIPIRRGAGIASIEYPEPSGGDVVGPTVYGHAGASSAISLGAVPYNASSAIEPYSSRGPATHYFEPVTGATPAPPLGAPQTIAKPDLAATDCGATTFFAQFFNGAWRFCGTSAAAPHAAAVAALMSQGAPAASVAEVRASLIAAAAPVGAFGPEAAGAGLVDALGALEDVGALATEDDPPSTAVSPVAPAPTPVAPAPIPVAPVAATPNPFEAVPPPPIGAPATFFTRKPSKVVRTASRRARVVFRFGSDQSGVSFLCKVDRARLRPCGKRLARRLPAGRHAVRVKARNAEGTVDRTPAVYRFRVKRVR